MNRRRAFLSCSVGLPWWPTAARAQQRASLADPLRLGADTALVESGLAPALQRAFGRDTGILVQISPGPALPLLEALERGELDVALSNAPGAEAALERQGLVHDRRAVAGAALLLVGPRAMGDRREPAAAVAGGGGVAEALQRIRAAATAGGTTFLTAGDGSGTHALEQALWRAAKIAPEGPWYQTAAAGGKLARQARAVGACALVERGSWAALGGPPLAVLAAGDALMDVPVHVMRSFRASHPAAKIFVAWVSGPKGTTVVAAQRGYRAPSR